MSCGLGAIVLVFMLVKHNVNDSSVELDNLKNDIQNLEAIKEDSVQTLKSIEAQVAEEAAQEAVIKQKLAEMQAALANRSADVEKIAREIEDLKSDIVGIEVKERKI